MFTKIVKETIESGLTEAEIASKVSVSQPTINRIRNGKQQPMGELAIALFELRKSREAEYQEVIRSKKLAA